jgi:hypothetical protein
MLHAGPQKIDEDVSTVLFDFLDVGCGLEFEPLEKEGAVQPVPVQFADVHTDYEVIGADLDLFDVIELVGSVVGHGSMEMREAPAGIARLGLKMGAKARW